MLKEGGKVMQKIINQVKC